MAAGFRWRVSALVVAVGLLAARAPALTTERVAQNLSFPVFVTAPAGDARLFIVEQGGAIKILKAGVVLPTPFLDVDSLTIDPTRNDERGLLGLAFPPDYASSGLFYVHYTGLGNDTVVRRYSVSADPDRADGASAHDVLFVDQVFENHKGGTIAFGPDGYLYIGLGDGGSANDPDGNGQRGDTLLGKMLRIDPSGDDFPADPANNYAIPPTNPFVSNPAFRGEIWAYGFRNPYRWSFDRETGDLYIGDVGQECWEEIDYQPAASAGGQNYGWSITEGEHCFVPGSCNPTGCSFSGITHPIREFSHAQDGFSCAVVGGYVYRGKAIPNLRGTYLYSDYCSAQLWSFRYDGAHVTALTNRTAQLAPGGGLAIESVSGFGEDGFGELYVVDREANYGEVYKIVGLERREALAPDPPGGVEASPDAGGGLELSSAAPNPFERLTRVELRLDAPASVRVTVYDAAGRRVRSLFLGTVDAGARSFEWDGRDDAGSPAPAGVYFLRAESSRGAATDRVTRTR